MTTKEKMFLESKAWALEKISLDKDYFKRLSTMSRHRILWIGSIDCVVPARELVNADPGELVVYRNIGGQVRPDDISLMSIIEEAVEFSKVEFIVVCGYSHCSALKAVAIGSSISSHLTTWLAELQGIFEANLDDLQDLSLELRMKRLSELNIRAQVLKLSQLDLIQKSWGNCDHPILLGWHFDLDQGSLKEIFSMDNVSLRHKLP